MTKEILFFNTLEEAKIEMKKRMGVWRPLYTDFIDEKTRVTFVNGEDDPVNSPEQRELDTKFQRIGELNKKLIDDTVNFTFEEFKELLVLEKS